MKKNIIQLVILAGLVSATGFSATTTTTSESAHTRFGFGLSTFGSGSVATSDALSLSVEFGQLSSIQALAAINNSDPFEFSLGSVYRYIIMGNQNLGWHIGAGFNFGTRSAVTGTGTDFYVNLLLPTTGLKFSLGGALSNVKLCFDGGMLMHLTPSPFKMYLSPLNALLGASIHYYF